MTVTRKKTMLIRPLNRIDLPDNISREHIKNPAFNYAVGRCFDVRAGASEDVTEIVIYDVIGDYWGEGVSAKKFNDALSKVKTDRIVLKINSPGGDVFDGIAIYNDIKAHPAHVTVQITGLAASAASIIAMAGDDIQIAKTAQIMIHNAWVMAIGNKYDLREVADILDEIDSGIIDAYEAKTGLGKKQLADLMDVETWMRGQAAIDKGFADRLMDGGDKPKAAFDISVFAQAPVELKKEIEANLCEAGYSRTESKAAVNKGFQVLGRREAGKQVDLREQREAVGDLVGLQSSLENFAALLKSA